jgi:hypothetical protein
MFLQSGATFFFSFEGTIVRVQVAKDSGQLLGILLKHLNHSPAFKHSHLIF